MDGSNGGRASRRNDSISSVMSFTADSPAWPRQSNDDCAAPTTPRDSQRTSRAKKSKVYHKRASHDHEYHTLAHRGREQPHAGSPDSMDSTNSPIPTQLKTNNATNYIENTDIDNINMNNTNMSEADCLHELLMILDELPSHVDVDLAYSFQAADLHPPVTHQSLAELDVARIINNPKLRHDVNFERELHFRPNLDGSRGKSKLKKADEYWKALVAELELYRAVGGQLLTCGSAEELEHWSRMMQLSQKRMPGMFETIKEVLRSLVPERDQPLVNDRLDVPMVMQQISKGVFDLMEFALWLATLLKAHCAPMRDDWIDQMVSQTRKGVEEGCQKRIVMGLRQTLGILEAMKLVSGFDARQTSKQALMYLQDVANHQIRHLRGLLIEDTVNFQQRYHLHRLNQGRIDVTRARMWYRREETHLLDCDTCPNPLETFTSAFLRSLLSQTPLSAFPETFYLDTERLRGLRSDLHNFIYLDICCEVFDLLARDKINEQSRKAARASLRSAVVDIVGESRRHLENAANIAVEIVRVVLHLEGATVCYDADMTEFVEQRLRVDLQVSSMAFSTRVQETMDRYLPALYHAINTNGRLTMLALHDLILPPTQPTSLLAGSSKRQTLEEQTMEEVLRRATHLAIIHWHVWSPMVYNIQDDETRSTSSRPSSSHGSDGDVVSSNKDDESNSPASSPSTPTAQKTAESFANQAQGSSIMGERPPQ